MSLLILLSNREFTITIICYDKFIIKIFFFPFRNASFAGTGNGRQSVIRAHTAVNELVRSCQRRAIRVEEKKTIVLSKKKKKNQLPTANRDNGKHNCRRCRVERPTNHPEIHQRDGIAVHGRRDKLVLFLRSKCSVARVRRRVNIILLLKRA